MISGRGRGLAFAPRGSEWARRSGGLSCADCGHRWSRVPRQPCPRCGSGDVAVSGYEGWAYEDPEQARDDPAAPFYYVDWAVYRCRHCYNVWQRGRRKDRPPAQGAPTT